MFITSSTRSSLRTLYLCVINTIKSQDIILMRHQHDQVSGHYTYALSTRSSLRTLYLCVINTIKSQDIIRMRYQHDQVSGHYTYASSTRSSLRTLYVCVINTIKSQDIILMRHQHDQVSGHYTYALVRILMYKYNHFRCTVVFFCPDNQLNNRALVVQKVLSVKRLQ